MLHGLARRAGTLYWLGYAWIAAAVLWSAGVVKPGWRRYAKTQEEFYARLAKGEDESRE
jgi:hypothetical protein